MKEELIRKKIYFEEDTYTILKETSDASGDSFSIVIDTLIKEHLPHNYLEENFND